MPTREGLTLWHRRVETAFIIGSLRPLSDRSHVHHAGHFRRYGRSTGTRPRDALGMGAAIVLGDDLDILMTLASVQFVLDPEVGKADAVVEVRQVVLTRPAFDLAAIAIGSSIAVWSAAVPLLEPFLILALELVVEDDAPNLRALVAEPFLFSQVGAIELDVVRQLSRPAHAGAEALLPRIVAVAAVGFQEVVATLG
jgi:hypothetical protein